MAKKKPADALEATAEEKAPKGKRGMLIPAVLVALAVLGAGAMAGGLIGGGGEAAAAATPSPEATATPSELGMLVQLDSVTLNLAQGRFLKLGVAIELAPGVAEEPPTAPIYDQVIELFGPMTFEELSTGPVREQTKVTLLEGLADVYGPDIVGVYYTEFVMQ